jgi:hypothetical protein
MVSGNVRLKRLGKRTMGDVDLYMSTQRLALKIHLSIPDFKIATNGICTDAMVDS